LTQGIVAQSATGITSEAGVTYSVYAFDDGDNNLVDSATGLSGTTWTPTLTTSMTVRIEIESVRAGFTSWQRQIRWFEFEASTELLAESGDGIISEAGVGLLQE
jgi:hypothetical protein